MSEASTTVLHPDFQRPRGGRLVAAERIVEPLIGTEAAFDAAIGQLSLLGAAIAHARGEAGMAAEFSQGSLEDIAETFSATVAARRALINTHRRLGAMQRKAGLEAVNFGAGAGKPLPA